MQKPHIPNIGRQQVIAVGSFLVLMAASLVAAAAVNSHFDTKSEEAFEDKVEAAEAAIQEGINHNLGILNAVQGLFNVNEKVTRYQFESFVCLFFDSKKGTLAFEWIPRIPADQREAFVQSVRAEGYDTFQTFPLSTREDSFPVNYIFPFEENLPDFGFDLASEQSRRSALIESWTTGKFVATAPVTLGQDTGEATGFLVFAPLYFTRHVPSTVEERLSTLTGFALAAFRVDTFVEGAIPTSAQTDFNLKVIDSSEDSLGGQLYSQTTTYPDLSEGEGIVIQKSLEVAGRSWTMQFEAPSGFGIGRFARLSWILVAVAGALLSFLFAAFSYLLIDGKRRAVILAEKMTESLVATEFKHSQMIDLSQDMIITTDVEGRFSYVSGAARTILGFEPSEMTGLTFLEFVHPDDKEEVSAAQQKITEGEMLTSLEVRFLTADGGVAWIDWNAVKLPGAADMVFGVGRDVTERHQLDQIKNEFISVTSHELKTPLTSIKGCLELLVEDQSGPFTNDQSQFLEVIIRNTNRMEMLVNDLLDLSRMEGNTLALERSSCDLGDLVLKVVSDLQTEIDTKNITIRTLPCDGQQVVVDADASRMVQILTNLLTNAIKYSPHGSAVDIELSMSPDGSSPVQVNIRDRGPGIPSEFRDKVFDKFFRVDGSSTRSTAGTGLGLSITKALVELHGGNIWIANEPGQGCTISFTVPTSTIFVAIPDSKAGRLLLESSPV